MMNLFINKIQNECLQCLHFVLKKSAILSVWILTFWYECRILAEIS